MNADAIWALWVACKSNTAEIAKELKLKECDVDSIISQRINQQYLEREKPFSKGTA